MSSSLPFPFNSLLSWVVTGWPYGVVGVLVIIIIFFLIHPEKVEKWSALFARLFSIFSDRAEKAAVSRDIQFRLKAFRKRERVIAQEILPFELKIKWVTVGENHAELKEGEVIVILKEHANQTQNFVIATLAYLQKGLLPIARVYCPTKLLRGMELVMAQRIILEERTDAFDIFNKETLSPERRSDVDLDDIVRCLSNIENKTLFTSILLPEISTYGRSIHPSLPEDSDRVVVSQIYEMIERVANKKPGVHEGPFMLNNSKVNLCVVLVAQEITVLKYGVEAHVKYIRGRVAEGIHNFYLLAAGSNLPTVERLTESLANSGDFIVDRRETYVAKKNKNIRVSVSKLRFVRGENHVETAEAG